MIKESELQARLNPGEASTALSALIEYNLERFLQSHVLRVMLPTGITASVSGNARSSSSFPGNTIDINITRVLEETTGMYVNTINTAFVCLCNRNGKDLIIRFTNIRFQFNKNFTWK